MRFLIAYLFFFIASVVLCIRKPDLAPLITRLLALLYSLTAFAAAFFGLWLWLYPLFWEGIVAALLLLIVGVLCLFGIRLLRYTYLVSLTWIIIGVIAFLASNIAALEIGTSLLISLPPIILAGLSLLSTRNFKF